MAKKKKFILIVDDDHVTAAATKVFLEEKGYEVTHAPDGEAALSMLKTTIPDLILLDIIMPQIDGFTVARRIRYDEQTKRVPIIVCSAQEGMKDLFAIEGINDYLLKPVDHDQLLVLVRKHLD
ncbi:MAG: response regulator [Candidatus Omnitrophica bacterium]|nr:response regulator [Candidatus Omnitrophota bacterium]